MAKDINRSLVLVDFDGTITTHDSFFRFIIFYHPIWLLMMRAIPCGIFFLMFKIGLVTNSAAKEKIFSILFKGEPINEFEDKCAKFAATEIPRILSSAAMHRLEKHRQNSDRIIVVSASIKNYLTHFCQREHFELISTEIEVKNSLVTGRFKTPNCYGSEKVSRVRTYVNLNDYESITAYGDSQGDQPMLNLASQPAHPLASLPKI
ncbi:MAG: haloacid dehalogenase-like hydrolase [Cyclobacteriaceae bacterium]|nr:haloacid dehalogenase-like hydrolase [Cyclobacteriaceae bacterium]